MFGVLLVIVLKYNVLNYSVHDNKNIKLNAP